jgi:Cu(I)/Ag(I) efflux system membrane protein CusA/SilA
MTATDPAPLEMSETLVNLKPESEWRPGVTVDSLIAEMNAALQLPGVSNAWTMPIKARIDMLSTGIRTPVGVKIFGPDLNELNRLGKEVERVVHNVEGTTSAFAERLTGGRYVEIAPDRLAAARYGLSVDDVQKAVATALGGETVTTTVEGRERYGVNVRYPRDLRDDPQAIASQVLVPAAGGAMVPLGQVASVRITLGPPSIGTENAQPVAYIYIDLQGRDLGGYVEEAARKVAAKVRMPPGYHVEWSGQFEYLQRARAKLKVVVPATLLVILVLLFLNFGRIAETLIVMLSVPFALVGGAWLVWWLGYNTSVAVAVGFIALAGVAAETGVVMLIYLDHALTEITERRRVEGVELTRVDLRRAIMTGAVERVRPKMMTVIAIMAGLLPILWSTGTGSEVMRRIAVPMVGGMVSSTILTLLVIPAIYTMVKGWKLPEANPASVHVDARAASLVE